VLEERAVERLGGNQRIAVDMRIVAATNRDLSIAVREGKVREDFYYRVNVVPIDLPPLRDRIEDIPLLVGEFLRKNTLARDKGLNRLSDRALNQLMTYAWPGNIRELQNVMERAVLRAKGDTVREDDSSHTAPQDQGARLTSGRLSAVRAGSSRSEGMKPERRATRPHWAATEGERTADERRPYVL
jgi:transcriptional regulator with GAF, ATPase, and Fis domain